MKGNNVKYAKLQITIFTNCYPLVTLTFITNQVAGLLRSGHEVTIISLDKPDPQVVKISKIDTRILNRIVYLDDYRKGRKESVFKLLKYCIENPRDTLSLAKYSLKEKSIPFERILLFNRLKNTDIVHAHFGPSGNFVAGLFEKGFFQKAGFVTTFHGYDLQNEIFGRGVYGTLFKTCSFFTVNSKFSKKQLNELGCPNDNIFLLPVGLDTNYFKQQNYIKEQPDIFHIIFVGRLTPFKGSDRAIEIFKQLHAKYEGKFKLTIIGDGELFEKLKANIEEHQLANYVMLMGARSQEEILKVMQQGNLFLFPGMPFDGREENQGLVIQEAQSIGLPVIVSDVGGIREGIVEGKTGFAIQWDCLDEFVVAVEKLYLDPLLRNAMGVEARKFVQGKFDTTVLNEKLLLIYKKAMLNISLVGKN